MRLAIRLRLEREARIPISHQAELAGVVYRLLRESDEEYAEFLHERGYALDEDPVRRMKLFVFSGLRAPASRRRAEGASLRLAPGPVDWYLSSPREEFLAHSATGLLCAGSEIRVGAVPFLIEEVRVLAEPVFAERMQFTCLTPVVASVRREDGTTHYLRPWQAEAFSEAVRRNALRKHALVHGGAPEDDRLELRWKESYLARAPHQGTKCVTIKGIRVVGVQAPLTLSGSPALLRIAYHCGLGEKNAAGFGMVEELHR